MTTKSSQGPHPLIYIDTADNCFMSKVNIAYVIKEKRCSIWAFEIIDKMWGGVKTSSIKSRYTTTRLSFLYLYYLPILNLIYVFLLFKKKRTNIFVRIYVMIGILLAILLIYFFFSLSFVKVHIF